MSVTNAPAGSELDQPDGQTGATKRVEPQPHDQNDS